MKKQVVRLTPAQMDRALEIERGALELARANIRKLRRRITELKKDSADWEAIAERYRSGSP